MKTIKFGLLGACILSTFTAPTLADDLATAVYQAISTHPTLAADKAGRDAVSSHVGVEKASNLPTVSVTGGIGREWSENTSTRTNALLGGEKSLKMTRKESGIVISHDLFTGYLNSSKIEIAEADLIAANARVAVMTERVALMAIESYLELYRARRVATLAKSNVAEHNAILADIKSKADSGTGSKSDVSLARGRVALAASISARILGDVKQAEVNYKEITGSEPGKVGMPVFLSKTMPASRGFALDDALSNHPALDGASAQIKSSKAAVRASKSGYYPKVRADVGGGYNADLDGSAGSSKDVYAMVRMSFDLYDGGARKSRVAEAKHKMQRSHYLTQNLQRTIEKNVYGSWEGFEMQLARIDTLRLHVEASAEVYEAYQKQFSMGQRTLLDLMNARSEAFTSNMNMLNGEVALMFSRYKVLAAMGNVSSKL